MSEAFQSGPVTESYPPLPVGFTGNLVHAGQHPLADFSCGGALARALVNGPSTEGSQDDSTTTDGELEACIGICDVGQCADGCKCSLRLKRKRPLVHAPAADLADGTFKRPPLFKEGDAVEFAAPERRIKVRTFGIVDAVKHVGAQPYYVVTSAKGTVYSFSEDCLRSKGAADPKFALQGSELVTIGDINAAGTILMLESVDEVIDETDDDLYTDAEAGQDNAADAAATSPDDMARTRAAILMTSFESRLQEHSEAIESKLHSQLEALVSKQELAHERFILAMSAQRSDMSDASERRPAAAAAAAAAPSVEVNPRLVAPVADDFTTPAAGEVPLQELMTSPLQALRSGALAMAGMQRRTSFGKVFDLNSSGGTASSQSPAVLADEPKSSKPAAAAAKEDD